MPEQEKTSPAEAPTGDGEPPKTAKQLEKEAKKAEKLAKLQAKLDKKAAAAPAAGEKKEKPEVSPLYARLGCLLLLVYLHLHSVFSMQVTQCRRKQLGVLQFHNNKFRVTKASLKVNVHEVLAIVVPYRNISKQVCSVRVYS